MKLSIGFFSVLDRWAFSYLNRCGFVLYCSSAPDTSGISAAALAQSNVAKDALDFYKSQYADQAPLRQQAADTAQKVADAQLKSMQTQTDLAKDAADYNKNTFRPLEQGIVSEANNFDTEAERERLAGQAQGDVAEGYDNAEQNAMRTMERRGVNVSDGNFGSTIAQLAQGKALASADAATKARTAARIEGRALKLDAANLGRGLPSQQSTDASLALTAGNSAVGNAAQPLRVAQQGDQTMQQGFSTGMQGYNSSGNLYGTAANIQMQQNAADMSALSGLGMAGAYLYKSDMKAKKDRKPVKTEVALAAVRKMPVESWRYKRGQGDSRTHIGPMAQDVHKAAGEAAAPGGKSIDPITMHGITLAAVQALDKKVSRMGKRRA